MKIAYLDCATGISGDMTLAALIDAGVDQSAIVEGVSSLELPGVEVQVSEVMKGGFRAKSVRVLHPEQHAHRHFSDIVRLIEGASRITPAQRDLALRIFRAVAEAEARVHGMDVEEVHFHEVGAIDSIVDIIGAAIGFDLLGADQVVCSPLPTGRGSVQIAHGICPVPAPGTAELLKGIPIADVPIEAELTTPTGAAIVKTVVDRFGTLPAMTIQHIGYGAGTMDFPLRANILRLFIGTSDVPADADEVVLLETNLDDVSGEVIGYVKQQLMLAGALDVYSTPIQMKKDRPGVVLSVISAPEKSARMEEIVFQETGTLGIRRQTVVRSKRARQQHTVLTPWGAVLGKIAWRTGEAPLFTPEFEDCAEIARHAGIPLREVYRAAMTAFDAAQVKLAPTSDVRAGSEPTHGAEGHSHDGGHSHDHSHDHHGHSHDHGQSSQ